jgi:F0F1-type ATP synthase membrane subunit b/b'
MAMADESEARKIMTKPLPQILDEIEESIKLANDAAKNAREAALEANKAGERAFNEATRVANERIDRVEQIARSALQLAELLKLALVNGITAVDKKLTGETSAKDKAAKQ